MSVENSMSSNTGVAIVSMDHTFRWVNDAFGEIIGYIPQELVGRTFESITHPDDLSLDSHLASRLLRGEIDNYEMQKRYVHQDGCDIPIHLRASLIRNRDGHILYALATVECMSGHTNCQAKAAKPATSTERELDRIRRAVIGS